MNLVSIERGQVTVTLDFTHCYAISQGLAEAGGAMAGNDGRLYQVYEAMSCAFLAAAAVGHMHGKVGDEDTVTLAALQSEYEQRWGNI
jgi:hypothetical protein